MLLQTGDVIARIPAQAVHDSVAAIVRGSEYSRTVHVSLLQLLWSWFVELLRRVLPNLSGVPHGRSIAIVALVGAVLLVLARVLYVVRAGEESERILRARGIRRTAEDHWRDAEQAAAEGRFTDAAHSLYRALLQTLARRERLRLHAAKTAGDYARDLRAAGSPSCRAFRDFGRSYDRIIYGIGSCDRAGYESLLALAMPIIEQRERAA